MNELFADGGVIRKNPSPFGGTWAFRILQNDTVVMEASGTVLPWFIDLPSVSNNVTEMLAVLNGLQALPPGWKGMVYSDSMNTLGRVFKSYQWNGIPNWMIQMYKKNRERLDNFNGIYWTLLDGHPTKAHLKAGIGKHGHPVSIHNVWCDLQCQNEAKKFLQASKVSLNS